MENDGLGDFRTRRTVIATQFSKCIKKFDYSQFNIFINSGQILEVAKRWNQAIWMIRLFNY